MNCGEYIRTELGDIKQITEGFEFIIELHNKSSNKIVKHSKNIIDLIQCGDYVNGHLVFDKAPNCVYIEDNQNKLAHIPYTKEKIKSVVTKEQYEQNSFKL